MRSLDALDRCVEYRSPPLSPPPLSSVYDDNVRIQQSLFENYNGLQDIYPAVGDRHCPHLFFVCMLTHLPPMFLLGNYSILVFQLLSPARTVFRGRRQVYLQLVFVIFMFPCLFQTFMCFIVVQDDILMHPALHVSLVWAVHADTSPRFHQLLALVTCFPPDVSSRLSLSRLDSLH